MPLETPFWWYRKKGAFASALAPLGRVYGRIAERRFAGVAPYRPALPVICIGNFTAGGGGKTPTAIAVASLLKALGAKPAFLTRGYGGKSAGPVLVAKGVSAEVVGDEPLLLAEVAPTMVAADRAAGAKAIEATDAKTRVLRKTYRWSWSMPGPASEMASSCPQGRSGRRLPSRWRGPERSS